MKEFPCGTSLIVSSISNRNSKKSKIRTLSCRFRNTKSQIVVPNYRNMETPLEATEGRGPGGVETLFLLYIKPVKFLIYNNNSNV